MNLDFSIVLGNYLKRLINILKEGLYYYFLEQSFFKQCHFMSCILNFKSFM